ncbi:MAG: EamA family transporter [Telluria sp.]
MSPKDLLLALFVVVAWGINFVVIKVGLHGVPPMLLGALRFGLAAVPAVFFVKRPQLPWRWLLAYGLTISFGQFAFLFSAIYIGMPAGLASLVLQAQAFFTLGLASLTLREPVTPAGVAGLVVAAAGLVLMGASGAGTVPLAGFLLTLCAAFSWATGNIVTKKIAHVDLVGLVVWGSLVPPLPFLLMSAAFEGPDKMTAALAHIGLASVLAIVYLAFVATLLGYGAWSRLLAKYPASQVAPFSLLVPVVGLASARVLLDERISTMQLQAILLVMLGLLINTFGGRLVNAVRRRAADRV